MATNPRVPARLPRQALTTSGSSAAYSLPYTEYFVGRPIPQPVIGLAALFGGNTFGPRMTTPWQPGPRSYVGGSNVYGVGAVDVFVEGGSAWGPVEGDPGFPHGTRWPGYPDDWTPPWMTNGEEGVGRSVLARRISVVFTCVDLISRLLSTMPLGLAKDSVPQAETPAWLDNPEPLIYSSVVDAIKAVVNSLLTRAEAFVLPSAYYADGYPARWFCLNPDVIIIEPTSNGTNRYWLQTGPEEKDRILLDNEELLHLRYQYVAGEAHGVGPLEAAWRNIASAEAMASYASQMSGRGGVPNAVIQSETSLTDEQAAKLKGSWRKMVASNGAEPVILTKGLSYTPLSLNARELALLDNRVFDEQRIAAAFGTPPFLAGLPAADSMTYTSTSMLFDHFWRAMLRPLARNIALGISLKFLPAKVYLTFDADELTRPGLMERSQAYSAYVSNKIMTADEVRIEEGLPPLGGDSAKISTPTIPPALMQNAGLSSQGNQSNQDQNQPNPPGGQNGG